MTFIEPKVYLIGDLYTEAVRDRHRYYGVPIRETRGFGQSTFYITDNSPEAHYVVIAIELLGEKVLAHKAEIERRERAELQATLDRKLRRRNSWRRMTLRKPLISTAELSRGKPSREIGR